MMRPQASPSAQDATAPGPRVLRAAGPGAGSPGAWSGMQSASTSATAPFLTNVESHFGRVTLTAPDNIRPGRGKERRTNARTTNASSTPAARRPPQPQEPPEPPMHAPVSLRREEALRPPRQARSAPLRGSVNRTAGGLSRAQRSAARNRGRTVDATQSRSAAQRSDHPAAARAGVRPVQWSTARPASPSEASVRSRVVNVWDEIELPDMQIVDMIDPPPAFSEQSNAGPAPYSTANTPAPIPSSPPPPFQSDDEEGRAHTAPGTAEQDDESASVSDSMEEEPVDEFTAQERIAWEADRVAGLSVLMRVARSQQRREAYLARKRAAEEEARVAAEGEPPAEPAAATEGLAEPTVAQAPAPSRPVEAPRAPEPPGGFVDAPVPTTSDLPPTSRLQSIEDSSSEAGTELSDENAAPGSLSTDSADERRVEQEAREALRRYETEMRAHLLSRSRGTQRTPLPSDPRRRASLELSDLGLVLPKAPPRQVADDADTSEERPVSRSSEPSMDSEQSTDMHASDTSSESGSSAVQLSSPETASEREIGSEPEDMAIDEHPSPVREVLEQQPETSGADTSSTLSAPDRGARRPLPPRPPGVSDGVATAQEQLYAMQADGDASGAPSAPRRPAPPPPPRQHEVPTRRPAPPPPDSDRLASLEAFLRRNTPLPPSALAWTEHAASRNADTAAARYPGNVFSNMHSSTAPLPRQTHLPTVTDDTRHFPPSLPVLQDRSLRPQGESWMPDDSRPPGEGQPAPGTGDRPTAVPRPTPRIQAPPVPPRRSSHAHPGVPASPSEISVVRHELASPTSERLVPRTTVSPRRGSWETEGHAEGAPPPEREERRPVGTGVPEQQEGLSERPRGTPVRQGSLGVTDLDVLVSQLDNPSTQYEQAVTLSEFLGQASPTAQLSREELQNIPVGRVEVESRRVSRSGKVKQKLSVVGVRVDRCGICLVQFRADQMACIFPCVHIFHEACTLELLRHTRLCPVCRHDVGAPPLPSR